MRHNEYVSTEIESLIATVVIDNPPMNPLKKEVMDGIRAAFSYIGSQDDVRVVIITGAGKAFVAGADIKEFTSWTPELAIELTAKGQRLFGEIENFPIPVIAAVNGYALGGGLELALSCDIRIASNLAKMGLPEVTLGIVPGYGGTQRLGRTIAPGYAKKMVFTGEIINADKALELGLVDDVTAPEQLLPTARDIALKIAANGPIAVRSAKTAMNAERRQSMPYGIAVELDAAGRVFASEDKIEGVAAFIEKRKPAFKNK